MLKNYLVCKWSDIQMASEYRKRKSIFLMARLCDYHFVLPRQNVDQNDLVTTYSNDHCLNFGLWSYETSLHLNTGLRKSFERLTTVCATIRSNFQSCLFKLRFGMQVVITVMSYQKNFQPNRSNGLGLTAVLRFF